MNNIKLPKESESQEIGHFAVITFNSCHPTSWRPTQTDGDADAGLDMQVQIVDKGHYTNVFNAQIKGTAQKKDGRNKKLILKAVLQCSTKKTPNRLLSGRLLNV